MKLKILFVSLTLLMFSATALAVGGNSCANAVTIESCPFSDSGNWDNDNDCNASGIQAPHNEVFYSFTPSVSGAYQLRVTTSAGSVGVRVLSGACCTGATSVGYSNTNVANDCGETANRRTYLSVYLVAGTQYWIQAGTNGSGASTADYTLDFTCVPCPAWESETSHNSCQTAQEIACGDSVLGFGATGDHPDWYAVTLETYGHLAVWVGGREWGHCLSGFDAANGKFRVYAECGDDHLIEGTDEGCQDDARDTVRSLCPGTYYIKVFNSNEDPYILKTACIPQELPAVVCPNVVLDAQHCGTPCGTMNNNGTPNLYTIDVPVQYLITDLNVRVNIFHGRVGDLTVSLITPWADEILLSSTNGGNGQHYTNTVFDDEAATSITAGSAPFTGSYRPEELLSAVDGFNAQGTWTLEIIDPNTAFTWTNDTGYVICWCLEFDYDQILDVELASFTATGVDGQVDLNWTTSSEFGNDRFEVMRDGVMLTQIDSRGDSPTGYHYAWSDLNVSAGRSYDYTLVAVDINGARQTLGTESATPSSSSAVITEYALHQNYPNPFNPSTMIRFDIPEAAVVKIVIVDAIGRHIRTLVNGMVSAGAHDVEFDAANLPSGIYFCMMNSGSFSTAQKMLLLK